MMDSVSSGSIQSLSDGEDHYNSRVRARAGTGTGNVGPMAKPSPLPPSMHPSPTHSHFNPFSNFFNPLSTPSLNNSWQRNPMSDHNAIGSMNSQLQAIESNVVPAPKGNLTLTSDHPSHASVRNPRKRARASRRAPTTVLTTDTSNFRAMVQEFTGIPAPPFTHPGSSFPRARLDLFGGISTSSPPNYLLRPFPQKPSSTTTPTNSLFLHLHPNTMSSIFNLPQVPNINLPPTTTDTSRNLHHFQTDQSFHRNVLPPSWGSGGGADQALFRSMNQKYSVDSKLNKYSASSSSLDFHADKGLENVTTGSEGIIESWISSSD